MSNNELSILFGPTLPKELEAVGLAFISAPTLQPDSAIASLSSERYARENFAHLDSALGIFNQGIIGKQIEVSYFSPAIQGLSNPTNLGSQNLSGLINLIGTTWDFPVINSPIGVKGMYLSKAGSWYPLIQPGIIWRKYTMATNLEPAASGNWLRRAIPDPGIDQDVIAIYTVPEHKYGTLYGNQNLTFPENPAQFRKVRELGYATGPNKITYLGNLNVLLRIRINGVTQFSSSYTGVEIDPYVKSIDPVTKTITVSKSFGPDDYIELTYLSYCDFYTYSGFRDSTGNYWPFDANPEYGHIIGDDQSMTLFNSSDALLQQITMYAIPSAVMTFSFQEYDSSQDPVLGKLILQMYRGIDYGETHFVRHIVSGENIENISTRQGTTSINTYGWASFGLNYYDENPAPGGDTFSNIIPSLVPLGRMILAAPASVSSVAVADIRQRGGGVPLEFPMVGVQSEDGLDTLRGFLDLGIWQGKAIKEGGVVEIDIDISILKTDPNDTDSTKFLDSEIREIVKNRIPPGIDFELKYVSF